MDEDLYQIYLDEIELIEPCTAEENALLLSALTKKDEMAKKRLVEGNLKAALNLVKEYDKPGIVLNDLVQEANMALMMAVESFSALAAAIAAERPETAGQMIPGAFEQYIGEKIEEALKAAVEAETMEEQVEEEVLARVNVLKDISQDLAEELGREATVEELAERMKMTVEEIKDIMKLTLDAISVTEE